ncbi:nucleotidyltransferase substrate binding protein [Plebeiibacterium marinum]|uniref:Nucleotidyltransferase substrate binding protein n=1 Tax=Plebeiibacterium marinum TaxID=2992111 RepID=A0AAE3MHU7_9BACT|nr:nucleotidyltransferase substrate binding protein [Plebeiobacterium marinum]MCW3807994.1 nucleotidyltransferase substrate binding protein [Plebeiobacterium marinum]
MTGKEDIRWEQRFSNYNKALKKLSEAIEYIKKEHKKNDLETEIEETEDTLEEIIKEGLIQRFEYTYEMAWNVMKDYALYQGNSDIGGSRDAIRFAFSTKLIENGDMWMDMIKSRIKTSHTYNEGTANEIYLKIINEYHFAFQAFKEVMEGKRAGEQQSLFDKE